MEVIIAARTVIECHCVSILSVRWMLTIRPSVSLRCAWYGMWAGVGAFQAAQLLSHLCADWNLRLITVFESFPGGRKEVINWSALLAHRLLRGVPALPSSQSQAEWTIFSITRTEV